MSIAKESIKDFMNEHFGDWLGMQLLNMKLLEYGQDDLDNFTDFELKTFIEILMKTLFEKIRTKDQVRLMKFILLEKIFGKKEVLKIAAEKQYSKVTMPIEFIYDLFGKAIGKIILDSAKEEFDEPDITNQDELKQILFMKKIIKKIFGESKQFHKRIDLDMLIFIKQGIKKENIIEIYSKERKFKNDMGSAFIKIIEMSKSKDPKEIEKLLTLIKEMTKNLPSKELKEKYDELTKNISKNDNDSMNLKITQFLTEYLGKERTISFIQEELIKFKIKDMAEISLDLQNQIIEDFKNESIINEYSKQRQTLLISKFKNIFK